MTSFALAGAGWMGTVHALALEAAGADLIAVASRSSESAQTLAARHDAMAVDYADLPAGADVVIVATPPAQHAVFALSALSQGAAVAVEKPLCTTLADADRLVRVAEAGAAVTYAENLLFADPVSRALGEIGALGTLSDLRVRVCQSAPTWGNFLTREAGGGVALDLGVHALAMVCRAVPRARPVRIGATFASAVDGDVEDAATISLEFDSGLRAEIEVSWRYETPVWDLQAASDTGVVRLDLLPELQLARNGIPVSLGHDPVAEDDTASQLHHFGYVTQIREIVYGLRTGRGAVRSDVAFGRDMLELVCAAAAAARAGCDVALPFNGPRHRAPIEIWRPADDDEPPEIRS